MGRRVMRFGMWTCGVLALLLGAALALSLLHPAWWSRGGLVLSVASAKLEVAWSDCTLTRQSIAYNLSYPEGNSAILVGPTSAWRPTTTSAAVGGLAASPGSPPILHTLRVVYVPLWPLVVLAAGGAGLLWWRTRRVILPGHCKACGYDLSGLGGARCPECGRPAASAVWRLLRVLRGITAEAQRTQRVQHGV